MIPKIFHRIWFGNRKRPEVFDDFWQAWQRTHPDWEFYTWTEENLFELVNQEIFDRLGNEPGLAKSCGAYQVPERAIAVQRADMTAYEILWRYGGVYLNCDMLPLRKFDELLDAPAFAGMEDHQFLCNAVMGSEQHGKLMGDIIDTLPRHFQQWSWLGMEKATGPQYFTEIAARWPIVKLPTSAFYPVHHGEAGLLTLDELLERGRYHNSFAVHAWGHRRQTPEGEGFKDETFVL
jgi:mannosyltransferase OCH1-like enzyme